MIQKDINDKKFNINSKSQLSNNINEIMIILSNKKNMNLIKEKEASPENEDKLMSVIFISSDQKIHYSVICKSNDKFCHLEKLLYDEYPSYKGNNYFLANGNMIDKNKTIAENKINNSDIIILKKNDNNFN